MRTVLGRRGERIAEIFLEERGYEILERNFRCRLGEIDLVARESGEFVFVEVKTRRSTAFGFPEEQISREKRRRLTRLALFYLKRRHREEAARMDVVSILLYQEKVLRIELIQNAVTSSR